MRLRRWLGVRHVQVLMLSLLIFLDVYQTETLKVYLQRGVEDLAFTGKFHRVIRALGDAKIALIGQALFACLFLGRCFSPFVVMGLNNKYLLLGLLMAEIVCYGFFQFLVEMFGFYAFIILTSIVFFIQAVHWPVAINIIAKWIPPQEHTRAVVTITAGETLARSIAAKTVKLSAHVVLIDMFNILVAFKAIWGIIYMIVGSQDPQTSFLIKRHEWEFLSREIGPRKRIQGSIKIPWKSILSCPRLYAMALTEIGSKWFFVSAYNFNTYCPEIEMDTAQTAMIFQPLVSYGTAWLMDSMIAKYYVSQNNARKIVNTIALWGGALSLAFMCYEYHKPGFVVFYFVLAQYFTILADCGQTTSAFDLSPNYATVIFSLYMVPAWASTVLRAYLDSPYAQDSNIKKSLPVFMKAGFLLFVFNYGFLMLGNITLLKLDSYDTYDWRKESAISYP